jgi:hypothetical protein
MAVQFTHVEEELKKHKERLAQAYERINLLEDEVKTKNNMV